MLETLHIGTVGARDTFSKPATPTVTVADQQYCQRARKRLYPSRRAAEAALAEPEALDLRSHPVIPHRVYRCGDHFHLTSTEPRS
jgi:hypothetical protein